jgi:hypothetical protein
MAEKLQAYGWGWSDTPATGDRSILVARDGGEYYRVEDVNALLKEAAYALEIAQQRSPYKLYDSVLAELEAALGTEHCHACSIGQSLERGEGTHLKGSIEHPKGE